MNSNLIKTCQYCNISKSDKDLLIWAKSKKYILSNEMINIYKFNFKLHQEILFRQNQFFEKDFYIYSRNTTKYIENKIK